MPDKLHNNGLLQETEDDRTLNIVPATALGQVKGDAFGYHIPVGGHQDPLPAPFHPRDPSKPD